MFRKAKASDLSKKLSEVNVVSTWLRRPEVLLDPSIPLPMHGLAPRVVLGDEWWEAERAAAFHKTLQHCVACAVGRRTETRCQELHGHERYTIDWDRCLMTYVETVPLCDLCHNFVHRLRLATMVERGASRMEELVRVLDHGRIVLETAGLMVPLSGFPRSIRPEEWVRWRLVVGRRKWPSLYKNQEEWERRWS